MKSAERNSTMKDVCMLAQGASRTTHIANIKRRKRRERVKEDGKNEKKKKR
jgi:F0F1-type ATP synthase epsilon subunit